MNNKTIFCGIILVILCCLSFVFTLESKAALKKEPKKAVQKEQPRMGGTLVFGLAKETNTLHPFINTASTGQFVKETAYESLLTYDDDGKIVPNLAESYKVSAGGKEFTFYLRKGVKFHNGKEMKADDVIWSTNYVKDPKNGAFGQNYISEVKSVEKIDDYTVRFTFDSPSVAFLANLATIRMLLIVPANSLQPGQVKLEKDTFVPGTGPFIIEKFQPGFELVVKKFPEYWGVPAYLDKIIFRPMADGTNRFNALRTGDIQLADRLSTLDAARVRKGEVKGIAILEDPLGGFQPLRFCYLNPLFQKLAMRQAISYAIDKKRLVDEAYYGAGTPADLMIDPNSVWAKAANIPPHKRDLAKAKKLLKSAGYSGQELSMISRNSSIPYSESLQRMLGEAGIKVKLEILDGGVFQDRYMSGKYDLWPGGARIDPDPVLTMVPWYYTTPSQKGSYSNPKVDKLLDSLGSEFDQKKRLKIFKELAGTIYNDVADIPLTFEARYLGIAEKVKGFGPLHGQAYHEGGSGTYFKHTWLK